MPKCGCGGQTCGCKVVPGTGVTVLGTGTATDPFKISVDPFSLGLKNAINVSNSNTIEFSRVGSGGTGDPLIISGSIVLRSPDNSRWAPTISNSGAVTWAKI